MKRTTILTALALVLCTGTAAADIGLFDGDEDGMLSDEEFSEGFNEDDRFGAFDTNRDGALDAEEFGARMGDEDMGLFDENEDGVLDNDEFTRGTYQRYDRDRSGFLEESEYADVDRDMDEGGLFGLGL